MSNPDVEAVAALKEARSLIEKGWTKGKLHETSYKGFLNNLLKYRRTDTYCTVGAINAVANASLSMRLKDYLRSAINSDHIEAWNDSGARSKSDVLEAFDKAIALAEEGKKPKKFNSFYNPISVGLLSPYMIATTKMLEKAAKENEMRLKILQEKYNYFVLPRAKFANEIGAAEETFDYSFLFDKPKPEPKLDVLSEVEKFVNSLPPETGVPVEI